MFTQGPRFATADQASAYTITVPDRLKYGDLSPFQAFITAYTQADIRVECHVQYIPADTASVRIMACRLDDRGFFSTQHPDDDVVDVYTVDPFQLGMAISEAVSFTEPGRHPRIVIPEYAPRQQAVYDTGDFEISHRMNSSTELTIPASEVCAFATVQSHMYPTRKWGVDREKYKLVWVRVEDDGDYIYAPDNSHATPLTASRLQDRVDRLIADDIAVLRQLRRN
jgi:hypothetical protein